jgi:hypothetical protein
MGPRRRVAPRVKVHRTHIRRRGPDLRLMPSTSFVRRRVTGRGIAPSSLAKKKKID